jgi:hypothetical protein
MIQRKTAATFAGLAVALVGATPAEAETTTVACDDAAVLPNPVYLAGSSAFEPTLAQLAVQLKAKQGISVIYNPISSCSGVTAVADSSQVLSGTAHYFTVSAVDGGSSGSVTTSSCTLAAGTKALIGVSDVSCESCTGQADLGGPAQYLDWRSPQR